MLPLSLSNGKFKKRSPNCQQIRELFLWIPLCFQDNGMTALSSLTQPVMSFRLTTQLRLRTSKWLENAIVLHSMSIPLNLCPQSSQTNVFIPLNIPLPFYGLRVQRQKIGVSNDDKDNVIKLLFSICHFSVSSLNLRRTEFNSLFTRKGFYSWLNLIKFIAKTIKINGHINHLTRDTVTVKAVSFILVIHVEVAIHRKMFSFLPQLIPT